MQSQPLNGATEKISSINTCAINNIDPKEGNNSNNNDNNNPLISSTQNYTTSKNADFPSRTDTQGKPVPTSLPPTNEDIFALQEATIPSMSDQTFTNPNPPQTLSLTMAADMNLPNATKPSLPSETSADVTTEEHANIDTFSNGNCNICTGTQPHNVQSSTTQVFGKTSKKRKLKRSSNGKNSWNNSSTEAQSNTNGGENTGRWTAEEHRLFLIGLERYGKAWKKISSLIKSRTGSQIKTHAQKYFQKVAKAKQNRDECDMQMEGRSVIGPNNISGSSGPERLNEVKGCNGEGVMINNVNNGMGIPPVVEELKGEGNKNGIEMGKNKRKAIKSVVASARKERKMLNDEQEGGLPLVAPCLVPYTIESMQHRLRAMQLENNGVSVKLTDEVLEDALYRFLTPATGDYLFNSSKPSNQTSERGDEGTTLTIDSVDKKNIYNKVNDDNSNSNINAKPFIKLPKIGDPNTATQLNSTDGASPTSVCDIANFPLLPSTKAVVAQDPPSWYSRGADIDELLSEADALNWFAEATMCEETSNRLSSTMLLSKEQNFTDVNSNKTSILDCYNTDVEGVFSIHGLDNKGMIPVESTNKKLADFAIDALPHVVTNTETETMLSLPSFSGNEVADKELNGLGSIEEKSSCAQLSVCDDLSSEGAGCWKNFLPFDKAIDERAFVSALLESNENVDLSVLT